MDPASNKQSMSKSLQRSLKIAVSVALILFLLTRMNISEIGQQLADAQPGWLILTFLLFALSIILRAVRWKVLLDALPIHVPLWLLSYWYYVGAFFNTILPTGFGGDVVKTLALARYSRQTSSAAGTVILDRFLGIVVLLAMGVAALPFSRADINALVAWFLVAIFLAAVAGFWLLRRRSWVRFGHRLLVSWLPKRWSSRLTRLDSLRLFYTALQDYNNRTLIQALAVSVVFNCLWVLINMTGGWALGIQATLVDYLVFVPLVSLALLLPSFGGVGVRELSYVGLFSQIGTPRESAFALSIVIYAATLLTGLFGGILYLLQNMFGFGASTAPSANKK